MEPPKEIYLIRDAANPKKILGDIASEKPMFSDDIKYIRADLVKPSTNGAEWGAEHHGIPETPNDLEEAADNHIRKVVDTAGHPGWDWATQDITDAFIAGAKWQKEQMMEEAVEGYVVKDITGSLAVTAKGINLDGFKVGDKVRIIIVKEDGK